MISEIALKDFSSERAAYTISRQARSGSESDSCGKQHGGRLRPSGLSHFEDRIFRTGARPTPLDESVKGHISIAWNIAVCPSHQSDFSGEARIRRPDCGYWRDDLLR